MQIVSPYLSCVLSGSLFFSATAAGVLLILLVVLVIIAKDARFRDGAILAFIAFILASILNLIFQKLIILEVVAALLVLYFLWNKKYALFKIGLIFAIALVLCLIAPLVYRGYYLESRCPRDAPGGLY